MEDRETVKSNGDASTSSEIGAEKSRKGNTVFFYTDPLT
jgi:hypothetical protein